jgi:ABC-type multidrug transport system fused ATPase/permease subunit
MKLSRMEMYRFLFRSMAPRYRRMVVFASLAMLGDASLTVLRPWPLKVVIDRVIPANPKPIRAPFIGSWLSEVATDRMWTLYGACATTLLIALGTGLLTYWYTRTLGSTAQHYVFDLRSNLFAHMQRLSLRFHDRQQTGDLITRLTSDVQSVQDAIASSAIILVTNAFLLLGMVGVMLWLNWEFALVALSVAPVLYWSITRNTDQVRSASRQARRSTGQLASLAQETLSSIRIVQGLAQEEQVDSRFANQSQVSLRAYLDGVKYQAAVAPVIDLLAAAGLCLVMWFGATHVISGQLTTGDVVIFFAYVTNLYSPMRALSKSANSSAKTIVSLERIVEILQMRSDVADAPAAVPLHIPEGKIEFCNVSFGYQSGLRTLDNINLVINPGETVAIVGATGAGKSTLVSLVPRFYDPAEGSILIDGQDIKGGLVRSLRGQISMVLQDSLLFRGTIRDNIAFGAPASTDEAIIAAAKIANAHDFIERLPEGYNTVIAEGGLTLSGGQRQRVSIARAVLRNSPILILDEPTSGLDTIAERAVVEALGAASKGRTTLIIAHRLATVRFADRIVVMEAGQIVECGTHQQLIGLQGVYSRLFDLQAIGRAKSETSNVQLLRSSNRL